MRSIVPTSAVLAAFFTNLSAAMPWLEPVQTPVGLMAAVGFSPLPTEAPGLGSIPKELLRKQNQVPYPPPVNWCGFVGGNPSDVLSCSATKSCVYSGAVLGCCDAGLIQTCTNLFTTCADYSDTCNSACQANYNILKCPNARPYCGTFAFDAGTRLYNCDTTRGAARSVEFLADYYLTAIGSQVLSSFFGPISITASNQVLSSYTRRTSASARSVSGTPISNVPVQTDSPTSNAIADPSSTSHSGISTGAVIGIVVGIVIVVLAILAALITWCCIRRRRQRPGPVAAPAPQMQQHQTQPQSNQTQTPTYPPQQQPTYPPQQPTYPPTQQGYFSPPASDPIKPTFNNNTSALPIPEADSTTTVPAAVAYNDSKYDHATGGPPRYSVANAGGQTPPPHLHGNPQGVGVLAPNSDVPGAGAGDYHNGYQHPPQSPTLTEVEGSSLYGHGQGQGQRPGLGQGQAHGYSQGSGTISPLATGGTSTVGQNMGTGYGQGEGQGYGQGPGQGAHEADGYGRPVPGVGAGVGGQGQGQGQGQGGYGRYGEGVYEIGEGERRR